MVDTRGKEGPRSGAASGAGLVSSSVNRRNSWVVFLTLSGAEGERPHASRSQVCRSFAMLRMTVWIYAAKLWHTTLVEQLAEKPGVALDSGWRSASALR
jgi:hypothetical protein